MAKKVGPYLRCAAVAHRLGVSSKALRVYEAHGLVRAERTAAGWRVYSPEQIARLHQVIALRSFGFSLSRIAELMVGGMPDLAAFLEWHDQVLRQEAERIDKALRLLAAARSRVARGDDLSLDDLMTLSKETTMFDKHSEELAAAYAASAAKHLSAEDQATLVANGYQGMDKPDTDWDRLAREAAHLMAIGNPESPEAMDLARRWMGKVFEATGGAPALTQKMKAIASEVLVHPTFAAASSSSIDLMDFVAKAYGAAIAAGIMPKPDSAI